MRHAFALSVLTCAVLATPASAHAQPAVAGARGDFIGTFGAVAKKFEALSTTFPAGKYAWSPGKGVRSVCATFTHIAAENYEIGKAFGGPDAPATLAHVEVETCLGDRATVVAAVKKSFDDILGAVNQMADSDLDGPYTLFGVARPRRTWLLDTAEHAGEHLGLLIAYARMNNIVPPWSK